jgi:hypothetical protein
MLQLYTMSFASWMPDWFVFWGSVTDFVFVF